MVKWYLCTRETRRVNGGGDHAMKIAWHERWGGNHAMKIAWHERRGRRRERRDGGWLKWMMKSKR